jgi:hypothetical protein
MQTLAQQAIELWKHQLENWPLAKRFYESLTGVQTREYIFPNTRLLAQYNPSRRGSTSAVTDPKAIAERPCFLCEHNRPPEQTQVDAGEYWLLVNPFPVFSMHFTLPYKQHIPQQILPYFSDFLGFAFQLHDHVVFYNGPRCGASAPDHLHFQAGNKGVLPLVDDYYSCNKKHLEVVQTIDDGQLIRVKGLLRKIFVIVSSTKDSAVRLFELLYHSLPTLPGLEPMMNIVGLFENGKWTIFVLPRVEFRPRQYFAAEPEQLMISPAAVEMAGILITPVEDHFQRLTSDDIVDIFQQISPD